MDSPPKDSHTDSSGDDQEFPKPWFRMYNWKVNDAKGALGPPGKLLLYILMQMNTRLVVPLQHSDIAKEIGVSRSTVSRHLAEFERRDLCVTGRGRLMMNPEFVLYGTEDNKSHLRKVYNAKKTDKKRVRKVKK